MIKRVISNLVDGVEFFVYELQGRVIVRIDNGNGYKEISFYKTDFANVLEECKEWMNKENE